MLWYSYLYKSTQCLQTNETQHYCRMENAWEVGRGRERVELIKSLITRDRKRRAWGTIARDQAEFVSWYEVNLHSECWSCYVKYFLYYLDIQIFLNRIPMQYKKKFMLKKSYLITPKMRLKCSGHFRYHLFYEGTLYFSRWSDGIKFWNQETLKHFVHNKSVQKRPKIIILFLVQV